MGPNVQARVMSLNCAAEFFPQHSKRSGAAAVMEAADTAAAQFQRLQHENSELRLRVAGLEDELEKLKWGR